MSNALQIKNITVNYGGFIALNQVNLQIDANTTLGLVGESGSGKSTLAKVVAGLITPDEGEVRFGEQVLRKRRTRMQHKAIQMVFQNPDASLNPKHTVRQILAEGLLFHHIVPRSKLMERCRELLALVHLDEDALGRYPHEFSGGQRQRIAIARAISVEPNLLIADEPTSALDVSVQLSVLELLHRLKEKLNLTMLFISHDMAVINAVCDTVAVMRQGRIIEVSPKEQFFLHPKADYSYQLLSAVPRMPIFNR